MTSDETAAALSRVREFLTVIDEHNARSKNLRYDDVIYGFNDVELRRSDLATVLQLATPENP